MHVENVLVNGLGLQLQLIASSKNPKTEPYKAMTDGKKGLVPEVCKG